ncbi:MAG: CvpA family protein [Chloroflexi bacterium]|nr:CvpA family protein [Chloroflexota bacterium]
MNLLDWAILTLLVAGAILGLRTGAVRTALTVAGLWLAMLLAGQFAGRIVPAFTDSITNEAAVTAIGYVIIFIVVFIGVSLLSSIIGVALKITMTAWLDKLAGAVVGLIVGVLAALALTLVLARFAYIFDPADKGNESKIDQTVQRYIGSNARDKVDDLLTGSSLVPALVAIVDLVPGDTIGLVPADFRTAFDILESRADQRL